MPVNQETVNKVANIITDDPEVILEAPFRYRQASSIIAKNVSLTPDEEVTGDVQYEYSIKKSGEYYPASRWEPADIPELEVSSLDEVIILRAYDSNKQPVPPNPQFEAAAAEYFWKYLTRDATDKAYEADSDF